MPEIYLEILDPKRKAVFKQLKSFKTEGCLAGGTALALQIKHRRSFDFDIFRSRSITNQFLKKVREVFGENIEPRVNTGDLLLIKLENNIEVHFVYYWYKRLEKTISTDSISLSSMADIAADKAHTIGRRGTWRDYVDIFYLLKREIFNLSEMIELAKRKFDGEFAPHLFLQQLSYYGDIQEFKIDLLEDDYSVKEIKDFLIAEVEKYTQERLRN